MKKKNLRFIKSAYLLLAFNFCHMTISAQSDNYFETSQNIEIFTDLYKELDMYYVDEIHSGDLIKTAIDEMLLSMDPYTTYIPESDIEDYRFMTTGQYGGIGSVISKRGDYVYISEPYEGYPAERAGLMAGDKIFEVNGKSAKGKTTEELSSILKGSPNTEVNIMIERDSGSFMEFRFKREKVQVASVPYYGFIDDRIAYIKLRSFTQGCANDLKKALKSLKSEEELKGIILDLRSNPGGLLNESVQIVNLFVEKGEEIVVTKGKVKDWEKVYRSRNSPEDTETPLVVLINSNSASASEIVSGSIQDLDRGVIIGRRSYGKGLVQQTKKLPYNAQLKLTVAKYYIPSGRCIQALDYSNRNEDGSVGNVPDSLITTFTTRNGREVKDGGGITPDIRMNKEQASEIVISLMNKRLIFDFATEFRRNNDTISPVNDFKMTDDIFNDFKYFLANKEYKYTTATEDALDIFKEITNEDGTTKLISEEIDAIMRKIKLNKSNDLENNKKEISEFLSNEIISRYYYQKGRIIEKLKHDPYVDKAIEIVSNIEEYNKILNGFDE